MDQGTPYQYPFKLERRTASLFVRSTGHQPPSPLYGWGPGVRNHHLIHHVISGRGVYILQDRRYELFPGDTFMIYPNTSVHYFADPEDPWECVWVGFDGRDAKLLVEQTVFSLQSPVLRGDHAAEIRRLLENIHSNYGTELWLSAAITGHLYLLLAFLLKAALQAQPPRAAGDDCAKIVADYIMTHYEEPITVEELAAFASVSHSSLYRSFKRRFHISPKRFLLEYRIERACVMLTRTNCSIQEVSNSVGFEDPFYFSRAFKAIKGVSPRQFASKNSEKEKPSAE